ncbi:hypothetical protein P7C71_g3419, partial [Lecanoromycetidae sp. Uapishka_2]
MHMTWKGGPEAMWYPEADAPMNQLVFFTKLLELLRQEHTISDVIFQDPMFTEVQQAFLKSQGFTVAYEDDAYTKLNPTTFVFAPRLNNDKAAGCFGVAQPALFIGNDIDEVIDFVEEFGDNPIFVRTRGLTPEYILDQSRRFRDAFSKEPLPLLDNQKWCKVTYIYWIEEQARPASQPAGGMTIQEEGGGSQAAAEGQVTSNTLPSEERPRSRLGRLKNASEKLKYALAGPAHQPRRPPTRGGTSSSPTAEQGRQTADAPAGERPRSRGRQALEKLKSVNPFSKKDDI